MFLSNIYLKSEKQFHLDPGDSRDIVLGLVLELKLAVLRFMKCLERPGEKLHSFCKDKVISAGSFPVYRNWTLSTSCSSSAKCYRDESSIELPCKPFLHASSASRRQIGRLTANIRFGKAVWKERKTFISQRMDRNR